MFNVGGMEFLVIAVLALVVLGPSRLPGAARQVGKTMGELRRLSTGFQNEMKSAFDEVDPRNTLKAVTTTTTTATEEPPAAASDPTPPSPPATPAAPSSKAAQPAKKAAPRKRSAPLRAAPTSATKPTSKP